MNTINALNTSLMLSERKIPHIEIIQLSENEIAAIIRPELNIEKFSNFIFPHRKATGLNQVREKEWNITLPNNQQAQGKIVIEPSKTQHCYTDRTKDVYIALTQIYYFRGMPDGSMVTSINEIIRTMGVPQNGKWASIVTKELDCLYKTTISWILSFHTDDAIPQSVKNQHILSVYNYNKLSERGDSKNRFQQTCEIDFDAKIKNNLKLKKTAPMNLTTRQSINAPIKRVLYDMVDMFLAKNTFYERRALNLVDDLQMSKSRYQYLSKRKALLDDFKNELDGKLLSTLKILRIDVLPAADGNDWKCRFRAEVGPYSKTKSISHLKVRNSDSVIREKLVADIIAVVGGGNENSGLYNKFALFYSDNAIHRALGEFKERYQAGGVKYRQQYFTIILHRVVHSLKYEWIKPCSKSCVYRCN